jgi:hypothetical protein
MKKFRRPIRNYIVSKIVGLVFVGTLHASVIQQLPKSIQRGYYSHISTNLALGENMKFNELRTAVKEAGIRPTDTAHVAEIGALAFRMGLTVDATMAQEKVPSLKEIRRRGWEKAQNEFTTQKKEKAGTR